MKKLLTGNEAIARGAWEAGVTFASAYPGTPSTEITENIAKYDEIYAEWAPNEKVALEVGIGACFAGTRVLVSQKHVGLNVAADPFCTLSYTGVNGGIVVITADDPEMHSSQNEQDNRYFSRLAKVPMIEPSDSTEALEFIKIAYDISEQFDTPVLFRTTTRVAHSRSIVSLGKRKNHKLKGFTPNPQKFVMIPAFARSRHQFIIERTAKLKEYNETSPLNKLEKGTSGLGIITSGISYQYAREVFPGASFLKLGMTHPLPEKLIRKFAASVNKLYVVEELEPYLEDSIKALGIKVDAGKNKLPISGEFTNDVLRAAFFKKRKPHPAEDTSALPGRPPNLCPGCSHRALFTALRSLKTVVFGDIGCYTLGVLPPISSLDACVCMGASIGMSHGYAKAGGNKIQKSVGILGDSTFLHSGITGVLEMAYNGGINTVIVLDNHTTAMTGGQEHPGTGKTLKGEPASSVDIENICRAVGLERVFRIDPFNIRETRKRIKQELETEAPSVIISTSPCPLRARIRNTPLAVDPQKCSQCGLCGQINCPALSTAGGTPHINPHQCIGCGICAQVCARGAIGTAPCDTQA